MPKTESDIKKRITDIEDKIRVIDIEIYKQLKLPFFKRSYSKSLFLILKRENILQYCLSKLGIKWLTG